ncbi:MAG: T9SS type A sorting domain-containing protein, partial [Saprospiraceae bacterium]|nr:T9SS type A sorting domain-containing protein [Saprospiraceae bacterium]
NPTVSHSGQYTVSVANADGCKTSKNIQVMDPPDIQAVINTSIHPNGDLGDATLFVSSGVGPFTVRWDNGDTSFTVTDLALGSHFVQVTDKYGCIQQFQFEIDASTAIDESSAIRQFSVFPNPVDQYLNVELELLEQTQDKRVELVDLNGKIYWHQVFSGHTLHQRIPTMNFGQGWYFLKVTTRNEHAIKPVIILH